MKKIHIDKEILEKLYIDEQKSMSQIHKELGVGYNAIKRLFNEYKIPKRDRTESSTITIKKKHDKLGRKITNLICPVCNKEFSIKNSLLHTAEVHCCSMSCSAKLSATKRTSAPTPRNGVVVKCTECGKDIYRNKARIENNKTGNYFCGNKCLVKYLVSGKNSGENHPNYNRKKVNCSNCGTEIVRSAQKIDRNKKYHFCNVKCMSEFYVGLVYGENHPSWRGGGKLYYGPSWEKISWKIRMMDDFTCKRCGLTLDDFDGDTSELIVHHIKRLRLFKCYREANKEENLVTLCRRCHGIVENNGMDFEFKRI